MRKAFSLKTLLVLLLSILALFLLGCPTPNDPVTGSNLGTTPSTPPTTITLLALPGIAVPAANGTPTTTIDSVQYTGTIAWSPEPTDGMFVMGAEYTATITLTAKAGYTLNGVAANSFAVAGATSVTHAAGSGTVEAVFPEAKSSDANLVALTLSGGLTLSPSFAESTTSYLVSVNVPHATTEITITGSPSDPTNATLTNSGVPVALSVGMNTITVGVTAHDGATTKDYTVTVFRLGPNEESGDIGTLQYVPAGRFQRDATATNISVITQPFLMSRNEITRAQFLARMGVDPSLVGQSTGTSDPVQQVSWYHAIAFANKLSVAEGLTPVYNVAGISNWADLTYAQVPRGGHTTGTEAAWAAVTADWSANGYRLPTEMEWMWAAMGAPVNGQAGATNPNGWEKPFAGWVSGANVQDYAWYTENSRELNANGTTEPTGTKLPNELGLHDMSGNVAEWVWDRGDWVSGYPAGTLTDYRGAESGDERMIRGGSFTSPANDGGFAMNDLRIRSRDNRTPDNWNPSWGFRLVRLAP